MYFLLFLEGVIAFVSPCLLPLLPVYIAYFAGEKNKPLPNAVGFVAGFTIVFVTLGAFAGAVGSLLLRYQTAVNVVSGVFIILLGLGFLGVLRLPAPSDKAGGFMQKIVSKRLTVAKSVSLGAVFSLMWTPCVGAFLGAALLRASVQGGAAEGMLMLFVFSMGLGLPLIASAVLLDRLKNAFDFIKKHYRVINIFAGVLLVIIGVLVITGIYGRFML